MYRAVQPFYLWPTPHCDVAKSLLDVIQVEDVKRGNFLFYVCVCVCVFYALSLFYIAWDVHMV